LGRAVGAAIPCAQIVDGHPPLWHEGLAEILREQIRIAQAIAAEIDAHPDFERIAPTPFSTLVFCYHPANANVMLDLDALNDTIINAVNATRQTFIAPTRLRGQLVWRLAIGNIHSDEAYVRKIWELIQETAAEVYEASHV
jgi:aromatic-L-amino-acid/L-tryptophan decarboxylase